MLLSETPSAMPYPNHLIITPPDMAAPDRHKLHKTFSEMSTARFAKNLNTYYIQGHASHVLNIDGSLKESVRELLEANAKNVRAKVIYAEICHVGRRGIVAADEIAKIYRKPVIAAPGVLYNTAHYDKYGRVRRMTRAVVNKARGYTIPDEIAYVMRIPGPKPNSPVKEINLSGTQVAGLNKNVSYNPNFKVSTEGQISFDGGQTGPHRLTTVVTRRATVLTMIKMPNIQLPRMGNIRAGATVAGPPVIDLAFGMIAEPLNEATTCGSGKNMFDKDYTAADAWADQGLLDKLVGQDPYHMLVNWAYAIGLTSEHRRIQRTKVNPIDRYFYGDYR